MSTGHRGTPKSQAELYSVAGRGDTPELLAKPVTVDTSCGVAYGGGISVDGKTVYIDAKLHRELMAGRIPVKGLSPQDVLDEWIEHEHVEWAIDAGDNPVDSYQGAHAFALAGGHQVIKRKIDPERYEKAIRPPLDRCAARYPFNAPKSLWCGPYLDVAFGDDKKDGARAKEILRAYREQGVEDAFKTSKVELHYGVSDVECRDCTHYGPFDKRSGGKLNTCAIVCGLVRADRSCDRYEEK